LNISFNCCSRGIKIPFHDFWNIVSIRDAKQSVMPINQEFVAEKVAVGDKMSGDTTMVNAETLLEVF
jgi:hypothetical protein